MQLSSQLHKKKKNNIQIQIFTYIYLTTWLKYNYYELYKAKQNKQINKY